MTDMTMVKPADGEARIRRRVWRSRWLRLAMAGGVAAIMLAVTALSGRLPGDAPIRLLPVLLVPIVVLAFQFRLWRETDEMQHGEALRSWAAMGIASMMLFPVLDVLQPLTGMTNPGEAAWLSSAGVAVVVALVQRARR